MCVWITSTDRNLWSGHLTRHMPVFQPQRYCSINDTPGTGFISILLNHFLQANTLNPLTNVQVASAGQMYRWKTCRSQRSQPGGFTWSWQKTHSFQQAPQIPHRCPCFQVSQCPDGRSTRARTASGTKGKVRAEPLERITALHTEPSSGETQPCRIRVHHSWPEQQIVEVVRS